MTLLHLISPLSPTKPQQTPTSSAHTRHTSAGKAPTHEGWSSFPPPDGSTKPTLPGVKLAPDVSEAQGEEGPQCPGHFLGYCESECFGVGPFFPFHPQPALHLASPPPNVRILIQNPFQSTWGALPFTPCPSGSLYCFSVKA